MGLSSIQVRIANELVYFADAHNINGGNKLNHAIPKWRIDWLNLSLSGMFVGGPGSVCYWGMESARNVVPCRVIPLFVLINKLSLGIMEAARIFVECPNSNDPTT